MAFIWNVSWGIFRAQIYLAELDTISWLSFGRLRPIHTIVWGLLH